MPVTLDDKQQAMLDKAVAKAVKDEQKRILVAVNERLTTLVEENKASGAKASAAAAKTALADLRQAIKEAA